MHFENTNRLLEEFKTMEMPVTNTTRGEQVQQTFRNKLTDQLKQALFADYCELYHDSGADAIIPYRTKEGVILEIPNESIANAITNEFGSGALSIEVKFTIKSLEYNALEMAEEFDISMRTKEEKAKEADRKKEEKIKRDKAAREARELKRAKMLEAYYRNKDN